MDCERSENPRPRRRHVHQPIHDKQKKTQYHQQDHDNCHSTLRWRIFLLPFLAFGTVFVWIVQVLGIGNFLLQSKVKENHFAIHSLRSTSIQAQKQQPNLNNYRQESKQKNGLVLTAFLEPPVSSWFYQDFNDIDIANINYDLAPPRFTQPLPHRTTTPNDLIRVSYPEVTSCEDIPTRLPVDCGHVVSDLWTWNSTWQHFKDYEQQQHEQLPHQPNKNLTAAHICPVVGDAYLPWIHDVVVNHKATRVHVVAQNYGRCHTGSEHRSWLHTLQPQGALLQAVSVQRIRHDDPSIPRDLWKPSESESATSETTTTTTTTTTRTTTTLPRYRLVPMEQADADGQRTRFICRFHAHSSYNQLLQPPQQQLQQQNVLLHTEESLSLYHFDYEFVDYRRLHPTLIHPLGKDQADPLTSTLLFDCPIPAKISDLLLQHAQTQVYLDIIPIRTPPRYGVDQVYLTEQMAGPKETWHLQEITNTTRTFWRNLSTPIAGFDPIQTWGRDHVLPAVEASGRWANIPLCMRRSATTAISITARTDPRPSQDANPPYTLTACTWVAASYQTRSKGLDSNNEVADTVHRLIEWLEFHLMVGVDHIYVYDNSNANDKGNQSSIRDVVNRWFSPEEVTYISWPHPVCNNRPAPPLENAGERSSQYAAEASCRVRFGPLTKWMISSLDVDEYLIPIYPKFNNLQQLLQVVEARNQSVLSFRSSRAKLRYDASEAIIDGKEASGRQKLSFKTFLEAYNCDSVPPPKPDSAARAQKEIFRPTSVLYHFVHYSLVTLDMTKTYSELGPQRYHREVEIPENPVDDRVEATLLHAKTPTLSQTKFVHRRCHLSRKRKTDCLIGFPWPSPNDSYPFNNNGMVETSTNSSSDGYLYNCYPIVCVETYWKHRLAEAMEARRRKQLKLAMELL